MVKRYRELLVDGRKALLSTEGEQAGKTARELLAFAAGKTREQLIDQLELYAGEDVSERYGELIRRCAEGCPQAYLLEEWSFFGIPLKITPAVLIPREDTAVVTALALEQITTVYKPRVLDLCSGSGCIGLAIAHHRKDARVTLGEISPEALRIEKENISDNHMTGHVNAVRVDALQAAPSFLGTFDLIVSNPPYVTTEEMNELPHSVRDFEPHLALHGGEDGLDFYREICRNFIPILKEGGSLCFEFGMGQGNAVADILRENGMKQIVLCRDTGGRIRAVSAQK